MDFSSVEEQPMFRPGLLALGIILAPVAVAPLAYADEASDFIAKWDPDHDGTLDLAEINKAADAKFDALDVDHEGTLSKKELGNLVTPADFAAVDKDREGTIDKAEYQAIVAKRLQAANPDKDNTIDAKELRTPAGRHLLELLH